MEEYIRVFRGVDGQPLRYGLRDDLIAPVDASDPTYQSNGSEYFTHDEEMITRGLILSGPAVLGTDPEEIGTFADSFITNRALIWYKMVAILQGSDVWTYLKPANKHRDGRLGFRIVYNHYLGPSNIDHMAGGREKKLSQCSYTGEKRNVTFEKYATLHEEQHNILEILKEHGYTGIDHRSKVSYLSEGINTISLYSVKTHIMSDESLRQYFDGCVTLCKEFLKQPSGKNRQSLCIEAASTKNASSTKSVTFYPEDRYYNSNEWYALIKNEKEKFLMTRINKN